MAGIEDVVVEWAPTSVPIPVGEPDWETLAAAWLSIRTSSGATVTSLTQTFTVGTATIKVLNGDTTGRTPTFLTDGTSYRGLNIRVVFGAVVLWRGRIDRVEFDMTQTPFAGFATLHCVDTLGNISDSSVPDELFPDTVDYFTQVADTETAFGRIMAAIEVTPP